MKLKLLVAVLICASGLFAQSAPASAQPSLSGGLLSPWRSDQLAPAFPSVGYFRKLYSTPSMRVELQPPVRLADYVLDGKLVLSMRAFLDLVMANNTDIAVQKFQIDTARNNLFRAFGTFDPSLSLSLSHGRTTTVSDQQIDRVTQLKSLSQSGGLSYSQTLPTGQSVTAGLSMSKNASNSANSTLNPSLKAGMNYSITQPLLRGRSLDIVRLSITTARAGIRTSELNLKDSIMSAIQSAEQAYWAVVGARETLKVNQNSLGLSKQSLDRSKRELELGAMPPLDIFQPEADYASQQLTVSQAEFRLAQSEDALRKQIGADLDPKFRDMPIVLTETVLPPASAETLDKEALVQKAVANRPDIQSRRVTLEVDDLNIKQATNQLRPDLGLTAQYSSSGTSGTRYLSGGGTPISVGGFVDAFDTVFARENPSYTFSLSLRLPLRDRRNAATLANQLVTKKSDVLSLRSREQQVRLDVLNAISQVESSRKSVELALISRNLAQEQAKAAQLKYDLGTTEMYFVLDAQNRLANAESQVVSQSINYRTNQTNLLRVVGTLLDERNIVIQ
jgi:outer membrane protein